MGLLTGNPYAGYVEYRAVKRELAHSNSPWEATVRVLVVTAMVVTTTVVVQSLFPTDPENPWSYAGQAAAGAAAEVSARVSHNVLDAAFQSHQEQVQAAVQNLGVSAGRAAKEVAKALEAPQVLRVIQGLGWMGVGGVFMAGAFGGTVASGGVAVQVAAPLAVGGAALVGIGALQVSYAVRGPEAYPGRTQGKIVRELNKAWDSLTYGGPGNIINIGGPPNLKGLPFWKKALFYTMHTLRALSGSLEDVSDFFKH